jgi:hypothetical protein
MEEWTMAIEYWNIQKGCRNNTEKGNLFAIPLQNLKLQIKIKEPPGTGSLKHNPK